MIGVAWTAWLMFVFSGDTRGWQTGVAMTLCGLGTTLLLLPGDNQWNRTRRKDVPLLLAGVFVMFGCLGPLLMIVFPSEPPNFVAGLVAAAMSGAFATLWAGAFVARSWWLIPVAILAQMFVPGPLFRTLEEWGAFANWGELGRRERVGILSFESLACVVVGYVLVIRLTRRISQERERSAAELKVAAQIHDSLVPAIAVTTGDIEILGRSIPSNQMGGDLIDAVLKGNETVAILADVSGHGVGAGIVMGMVKSSARALLLGNPGLERLLTDLNVVLSDLTKPEMFATMAAVRVAGGGRFEFGLAGHLPILQFVGASRGLVERPNESLPLGVEASEKFQTGTAELAPGDTLVLLTDGLVEVQNAAGHELGLNAIRRVVSEHGHRPLKELAEAIMAAGRSHGPQLDDQSVLLIRRRA